MVTRSCLKSLGFPTKGQPWELWEPPASEGVVNLLKKSIAGLDSEIWCIYIIITLSYIVTLSIYRNDIKSRHITWFDGACSQGSLQVPSKFFSCKPCKLLHLQIKFETAKPVPWKGSKHQPKGLRCALQFLRLSTLVQARVWRRLQHQRSHSFESLEQASRLRLP